MTASTLHAAGPLPAQPLIATAVLRELTSENHSDLTALVEIDPSLSVAVLHAANSPHLRQTRRVASVRSAMVVLGSSAVESIATCRTAALVLGPDDVGCPPGFWVRSVATAAASSVLAESLGVNVDEAFTAGLLHDLGDLILYRSDPELHGVVAARMTTGKRSLLDQEHVLFGCTHTDVGADQLERWFLPERVVRAVRWHHASPEALTDSLARAVWGGQRIGLVAAGLPTVGPRTEISSPAAVLKALGLVRESADRILAAVDRKIDNVVKLAGRNS